MGTALRRSLYFIFARYASWKARKGMHLEREQLFHTSHAFDICVTAAKHCESIMHSNTTFRP